MSTHNIGFYEEISKIITELSSNISKYAPYLFCCQVHLNLFCFVDTTWLAWHCMDTCIPLNIQFFMQMIIYDSLFCLLVIPPANCVCGRVYCFHVVRTNERPNERKCVRVFVGGYTVFTLSERTNDRTNESVSVTFCFLNILKSH